MRSSELSALVLAVVASTLCAAALYSGYSELKPLLIADNGIKQRVDNLVGGLLALGVSSYSHDLALNKCRSAQMSPAAPLLAPQQSRLISEACLRLADDVLASSPASAHAAFVAAFSTSMLKERRRSETYLERSRRLAPNEAWLASLRLRLFRRWTTAPAEDMAYRAANDIQTLGLVNVGREWLARWYLSDETARPMITAALEDLPDAHKAAFVAAVGARREPAG